MKPYIPKNAHHVIKRNCFNKTDNYMYNMTDVWARSSLINKTLVPTRQAVRAALMGIKSTDSEVLVLKQIKKEGK